LALVADLAGAMSVEALREPKPRLNPRSTPCARIPVRLRRAAHVKRISPAAAKARSPGATRIAAKCRILIACAAFPRCTGFARCFGIRAGVLDREINSVTDNPLVFPAEKKILSGGNFHGQIVAIAMDALAIAAAELASISEQRIEKLINPAISELPPFLTDKGRVE